MTKDAMTDTRRIGDSFAVAILQWPAVVGAIAFDGPGWELALRIVLATWAVLLSLGMILGRRNSGRWGLAMTLCAGLAAGLWLAVPSGWSAVWFVALIITFHAALRARMDETDDETAEQGSEEPA